MGVTTYTRGFHPYGDCTMGWFSTLKSLGILGPHISRSTTPTLDDWHLARANDNRYATVDLPTP